MTIKTYLDYKNQISGLEDVFETVKTIEKIAASSIHLLREKVNGLKTYSDGIGRALERLLAFIPNANAHPLLTGNNAGAKAIIVITGDKGLVGDLWHKIINEFLKNKDSYREIIAIGAKGKYYLEEEKFNITEYFGQSAGSQEGEDEMKKITSYIFGGFSRGKFSRVDILYPQFVSLAQQEARIVKFLPFEFGEIGEENQKNNSVGAAPGFPVFEPSKSKIFNSLLGKYIGIYLRKIIIEAALSEFSARTLAMEDASAKTEELIKNLSLDYSKERRRVITQKQLEVFASHNI